MSLNLHGIDYFNNSKVSEYNVNHLDNTWDFSSPDNLDDVEVILEQL